jgi:hypothetical protein
VISHRWSDLRYQHNNPWTVQRLLGFLRSTSSRPDQRLGSRYPEFAAEVERAILSVEPTGGWTLNGVVSVVLART